jgi:hypothetical protein
LDDWGKVDLNINSGMVTLEALCSQKAVNSSAFAVLLLIYVNMITASCWYCISWMQPAYRLCLQSQA